jgi:hypothetical protein
MLINPDNVMFSIHAKETPHSHVQMSPLCGFKSNRTVVPQNLRSEASPPASVARISSTSIPISSMFYKMFQPSALHVVMEPILSKPEMKFALHRKVSQW